MFKNILNKLKKDELLRGSFILLIMINIYNFINYMFHFSMARMLGPADYGVLMVLFSIISIISIPSEAIQNVITTYTSRLSLKKENGKIKSMLFKGLKKGFLVSIVFFILYLPFSFFLSYFLKISYSLFVITGILIFFLINLPIIRGILQGQKKFSSLGFNMITESSIKLLSAVILVFLGIGVYGPIFGVILGLGISFFLAFFLIGDILNSQNRKEDFNGIYSYSIPYFVSLVSIMFILSLDIIFAKRFFSPELAGKYSVASMLGKMIFLGVTAISKVIVPISVEKSDNGEKTKILIKKALFISGILSCIILLFYLLFPKIIVLILFGRQYLDISNIIFITGLSMTLLSFSNLIILYGLSVGKIKNSSFSFIIFILIEIVFFYLFHQSVLEYSIAFLIVNFLMFVYSLFLIRK